MTFFNVSQILAAHRYGIKRVILPERNLKDLVEVPSSVLSNLEVILLPCFAALLHSFIVMFPTNLDKYLVIGI